MQESGEYRVTRHSKGSGADSKDAKIVFHHLDEAPARRFYEQNIPPVPGTVLSLWKPDGSLIAHSAGGRRDYLTIAEAAQALGYSADTIRRGVVKGAGPLAELLRDAGRKGNEGQWLISLSDEQIARHRKASIGQPTPPQEPPAYASVTTPEPADQASIVREDAVLLERIAGLEKRLADRDAEISRQAEEVARLRVQMVERDAAHRAERSEMLTNAAAERERLLTLIERATERPPGIVERLLAVLRPNRS
jgi:hypothetical protein